MENRNSMVERFSNVAICLLFLILLSGCSDIYYGFLEKFGIHKRDILVERVEETQDAQSEAQEEFKSALEQFASVITIENTKLKEVYEKLSGEYEDCLVSAQEVYDRIEKIESISNALFKEWRQEISMYQNEFLKSRSSRQLNETMEQYEEMISLMYLSINSMRDVLLIFRDNVIFLKHNLNAQAIGTLHEEFSSLQMEVDLLIQQMRISIDSSNTFIENMRATSP